MQSQVNKIHEMLKDGNFHCVNEFIDTYCVDYRRRLKDLQDKGHQLESRKCCQHNFHKGGSKEWRLIPKKPLGYQIFSVEGKEIFRQPIFR